MRIGFLLAWPKGSLTSQGNVLGDELLGEAMCRTLRGMPGVDHCELYAPNAPPPEGLDVLVHLNDDPPERSRARRHVLYLQNAYGEGSDRALARFHRIGYDGYAFISKRLLDVHEATGRTGIFLPFGVETSAFYPRERENPYRCDVSYVGNDIKGEARTLLYLYPALSFDFALYGNWRVPYPYRFWKNRPYQRAFAARSRGKIPQADVPLLYSASRVNLNCTAQDCVDWDVITLRTFEVLACGGFLITDRVPSAERELADCLVFTDGGDDLRDKIAWYLERPAERDRIAENGYRYVTEHATVGSRMTALLAYLKELL